MKCFSRFTQLWIGMAASLFVLAGTGCITFTSKALPAYRLPAQLQAPSRCGLAPINFAMLAAPQSEVYTVGPGDSLGITIQGVVPSDPTELPPLIQTQNNLNAVYYPPGGMVEAPNFGLPITVSSDGKMTLPFVDSIDVNGLSLPQVADKIRIAYLEKQVLKEGRDQVNVVLLRSRVSRIVVLREDASLQNAQFMQKGDAVYSKRGSATVVDLPFFESDVLHALAASGGLPGVDAYNEVWILRKGKSAVKTSETEKAEEVYANEVDQVMGLVESGETVTEAIIKTQAHLHAIRIPLKLCPNESVPFTPEDVVLEDGDVVYVEPRRDEYFYTGGLLQGGQIPFPRDEDLDVLEAIALSQGSVGGFGATSSVIALRSGGGPGNIVPPTRVMILRKAPGGQQIAIRVDLNRAKYDPTERIRIMPGDFIIMNYKPSEIAANVALNIFNFTWAVNR